jgi:hypothetical protein
MGEFDDLPTIEPGIYEHYKGHRYRVLGVGCHTETNEYFVVYGQISEHEGAPDIWIRPHAMFVEQVTKDGKTFPRFKKIGNG